MLVKRAYKYRFYPTEQQQRQLLRTFGCVRLVYNRALQARADTWGREQRTVNYAETSAMLTVWKKSSELTFLNHVSSVPLQQTLRHLQSAFTSFFNKRAKFPRFKSRKKSRASAEYTRSAFVWRDGRLKLAKMDQPLSIRWSRPLPEGATPSTVTVSLDPAGRWFVSILIETGVSELPRSRTAVGVDLGVTSLVTLSTGEKIGNPRHEQLARVKLARAQRRLARRVKGSANRAKARRAVARIHAGIADRRRDLLHKLTTRLVRENQTIVIEDLNVSGMLGRSRLARAISDAAWSEFRTMIEYKAAWRGRAVVVVDRWFPSSKICSGCRLLLDSLDLSVRTWTCTGCGTEHDRDINAAKNILTAGLAVAACGGDVRPTRHQSARRSPVKQESRSARVEVPCP
ncbi:RNA-guided endonuclease InsQ/TnpB family protein [Lentzea flaviverrucosa]|uniref:Putative transposase n=1 Tax=Lentzea flaviverrucosa TaxID=200379 RepID=A0A1H9M155_9PSEU|nr:RNA-guided endonuclease TnpB family protein [Lentzea flaviverrucosa]RDI31116.1 putative transposase [Lentzea flaviverrucosa]SER17279.1 putative transposase [Lentzea flaviverrucosa]